MESNNIKVLVTGSKGQLGSEIRAISSNFPSLSIAFTDIDELDITDSIAVNNYIIALRPNFIINCAAYTAVDKAEQDIETSSKLNSIAPGIIANACKDHNCRMIHISTDYVFDGASNTPYNESSLVNPMSQYGKSKLKGDEAVLATGVCMVIRTSWLYSSFGGNFVKTIIRNAKVKPELRVVSDQIGCPTYARDLANVILKITSKGETGFIPEIFNYSNEGTCSWYEFASKIITLTNINCRVTPIETKDYPLPAKRPQFSVFNKSKIRNTYQFEIPTWEESLRNCIEILKKEGLT